MAGTYTFTVIEGEDFTPALTWIQPDGYTPVDLTGWAAQFIADDGDGNPLLMVTTTPSASGSVTLGGTAGTIQINIPAAVIAAASFTPAAYRLLMTSAGNITTCLLRGKFLKEAA